MESRRSPLTAIIFIIVVLVAVGVWYYIGSKTIITAVPDSSSSERVILVTPIATPTIEFEPTEEPTPTPDNEITPTTTPKPTVATTKAVATPTKAAVTPTGGDLTPTGVTLAP